MVKIATVKSSWICLFILLASVHYAFAQVSCPANFSLCYSKVQTGLTQGQPSGGVYSGSGVVGGFFDPSAAGVGAHVITYTVENVGSCSFTITVRQKEYINCVMEHPLVCLDMQAGKYSSCVPAPGSAVVIDGPGYAGGIFYPKLAGVGQHNYLMTATDANGCISETQGLIEVYEGTPPVIDIPDITVPNTSTPPFVLTGGQGITYYNGVGVSGNPAMGTPFSFYPAAAGNGTFTIDVYSVYPDDDGIDKYCYSEGAFKIRVGSLPVTLVDFSASVNENDIVLNWRTAMEKDFDRFEIERSTDPKKGFSKISHLKGASADGRYSFRDLKAESGMANYYRLKMVDADGTSAYSKIEWALKEADNELKIYPNPVKGKFTIDAPVLVTEIHLINSSGSTVMSKEMSAKKKEIELPALPAGVYLLELKRTNAKSLFSKIMVQ